MPAPASQSDPLTAPDGRVRTACHLCGQAALERVAGFEHLRRVTSDCQPWPAGGTLAVCSACGGVQHPIDDAWHDEVGRIYAQYRIYHQSDGAEQAVFDAGAGAMVTRSEYLLGKLVRHVALPSRGRLLDVGCGNGALLNAAGRLLPNWTLGGTELSDQHRAMVEALPGVECLHVGPLAEVPGQFDLVTLVHVLEHVGHPQKFLEDTVAKLAPGGLLLIEVPDHDANAFDLLIADHASHFTRASLIRLIGRSGLEVVAIGGWVSKEVSLVAHVRSRSNGRTMLSPSADARSRASEKVAWLRRVLAWGQSFDRVTLFGTSIAATWLADVLGDRVVGFVDEDPARIGRALRGLPVMHPAQVPVGADVLLLLPSAIASQVKARLDRPGVRFHLPPVA